MADLLINSSSTEYILLRANPFWQLLSKIGATILISLFFRPTAKIDAAQKLVPPYSFLDFSLIFQLKKRKVIFKGYSVIMKSRFNAKTQADKKLTSGLVDKIVT